MLLTFIGLATMLLVVYGLVRSMAAPLVVLTIVPILAAALAGFSPEQIGEYANKGMLSVVPIATLFIFAILFFSIVREAGIFDPLVNTLLKLAGDSVWRVTIATAVVAFSVMLEGIGPATFLITIPTFLPVYQRVGLSRYDLLFIAGLSAGVANFAPWGGPMGRASLALHLPPVPLWVSLIPIEIVGAVIALGVAAYIGKRAEKRQAAGVARVDEEGEVEAIAAARKDAHSDPAARRSGRVVYWTNVVLTAGAMASMILTKLPPSIVFLVALTLALIVNFKTPIAQVAQIRAHASEAVTLSSLMLAAGCFIGIMSNTDMFPRVAAQLIEIIPDFMGRYIHVIVGAFSIFLGILFSPDAFYLGLMPMVNSVAHAHGIPPESVAHAMMIGECVGFSATPAVPAAFLAAGLAGCDLGQFMRRAVVPLWLVSVAMLAAAIVFGIVKV